MIRRDKNSLYKLSVVLLNLTSLRNVRQIWCLKSCPPCCASHLLCRVGNSCLNIYRTLTYPNSCRNIIFEVRRKACVVWLNSLSQLPPCLMSSSVEIQTKTHFLRDAVLFIPWARSPLSLTTAIQFTLYKLNTSLESSFVIHYQHMRKLPTADYAKISPSCVVDTYDDSNPHRTAWKMISQAMKTIVQLIPIWIYMPMIQDTSESLITTDGEILDHAQSHTRNSHIRKQSIHEQGSK